MQDEPREIALVGDEPVHLPRCMRPAWETECTIERALRHRDDVLEVYLHLAKAVDLGDPMAMLSVLNIIETDSARERQTGDPR